VNTTQARLLRGAVILIPGLLFILFWQALVAGNSRLEFLFASPLLVVQVAFEELSQRAIWIDLATTAGEAVLGLLAGSLLGSALGLLLWTNDGLARLARPYIVVLGSIPIFAIAPMLIIWFGTDLLSKVVMSAFSVFFVALAQAYDGACACAKEYLHYAKTLRASRLRVMQKIIIPGALRWVAAGFKISIGLALVGAFIGEFVSSQVGLGHYILTAGSLYDMPRVIFGVLLLSLLALSFTGLVWCVERAKPHLYQTSSDSPKGS
jgi:NitT/TauT family transport system permease protein